MINIKKLKDECQNHDECQNQYILQGEGTGFKLCFIIFQNSPCMKRKTHPPKPLLKNKHIIMSSYRNLNNL